MAPGDLVLLLAGRDGRCSGSGCCGIGLPEQGESASPGIYVLGFCMYVALAFVTIFFNAAVIGTAMKRLAG